MVPAEYHIPAIADKVNAMDERIEAMKDRLEGKAICQTVLDVYGIDYCIVPVLDKEIAPLVKGRPDASIAAIDLYLSRCPEPLDGPVIRKMMNGLFGTNLEGIAALSRTRISLFTKGQWIAKKDKDLFAIHTGREDIDVKVIPTLYFVEQTGRDELPEALAARLYALGYRFNEAIGAYYYSNPEGVSVPDAFKGKTIGSINEVTEQYFSHL
jgi:hypothetical protein